MSVGPAIPLGRRIRLPASVLRLVSDERLIEEVRGGSERAFEVLLERRHRPVLAFCMHMLGSKEEAEDEQISSPPTGTCCDPASRSRRGRGS